MIEIPYGDCSLVEYVSPKGNTLYVELCICQFSELGTYTYATWEDAKRDLKDYYEIEDKLIERIYNERKVVKL